MKDFVSLNIHEGLYSLDKYLSYETITPTYKAYLSIMSHIIEPQSHKEAASNPRYLEAMNAEIQALQDGKIPIRCKLIFKFKYKLLETLRCSKQV